MIWTQFAAWRFHCCISFWICLSIIVLHRQVSLPFSLFLKNCIPVLPLPEFAAKASSLLLLYSSLKSLVPYKKLLLYLHPQGEIMQTSLHIMHLFLSAIVMSSYILLEKF
jgi:hypothetical protein